MTSKKQRLVLVINAGSSSIKYRLFDMREQRALAKGLLERIGSDDARLKHRRRDDKGDWVKENITQAIPDHATGLALIGEALKGCKALAGDDALYGIGHRVVHGGERFQCPTRITPKVVAGIRDTIPLAPLHNPANLLGIEVTLNQLPKVPQVAVFDTAFHATLPPQAYTYALPRQLYKKHGVRRYGFHGTSHGYVARQTAAKLDQPLERLKVITLHLGNGASAAAIDGGRCIDTSMGMTPLEGLVMGTRSGDIDPAIPFYLARETGMALDDIEQLLNHESGLTGIAGIGDMREILSRVEQGDQHAELALNLFCYRIKKTIGAYTAALGRLDALVFTGGIGENAAEVRRRVCAGLQVFGIQLDDQRNILPPKRGLKIHAPGAGVAVLVMPTNEELEIALQTVATIKAGD